MDLDRLVLVELLCFVEEGSGKIAHLVGGGSVRSMVEVLGR